MGKMKPFMIKLDDVTRERLDVLAEADQNSQGAVIRQLINRAYEMRFVNCMPTSENDHSMSNPEMGISTPVAQAQG